MLLSSSVSFDKNGTVIRTVGKISDSILHHHPLVTQDIYTEVCIKTTSTSNKRVLVYTKHTYIKLKHFGTSARCRQWLQVKILF